MQRPKLITVTSLLMAVTIVIELAWPVVNFTIPFQPVTVDPRWVQVHAGIVAVLSALFIFYYWRGRTWARTLVLINCVYRIAIVAFIFTQQWQTPNPQNNEMLLGFAVYQVALALFLLVYLNTKRVLVWFADEPVFKEFAVPAGPETPFVLPPLPPQPEPMAYDPEYGGELKRRGIIFMVFGVLAGFLLHVIFQSADVGAWQEWLSFFITAAGVKFYLQGKRHLALSMQEAMEIDPRPPVLYLRSFTADKTAAKIPTGGLMRRLFGISGSIFDLQTEEELLAEVLNRIGPVVCIGRPGEDLPELGAKRFYVSHEEWQQAVHDFMVVSKLVVLRLGDTPGFWWEVERAVKTIEPTRLLLIVPFGKRKYRQFVQKAQAHFPHPLPKYESGGFLGIRYTRSMGTMRGFIYFNPDWTPTYVDLVPIKPRLRLKARFIGRRRLIKKLLWGLRPVFMQTGVAWEPPKARVFLTLLATVPLTLVLGTIGYFAFPYLIDRTLFQRAQSTYIARLQNSPEIQQAHGVVMPEQADQIGLDLSKKGLARLSDSELIERERLYSKIAAEGECSSIALYGIHSEDDPDGQSYVDSLSYVDMNRWFQIQGDAAIAEAKYNPPAIALTEDESETVYEDIRQQMGGYDPQSYRMQTTFSVMSGHTVDPDAKKLYARLGTSSPGEDETTYPEICAALRVLQQAALAFPEPENGRVARLMAQAEK